jgi:hypothetical protein
MSAVSSSIRTSDPNASGSAQSIEVRAIAEVEDWLRRSAALTLKPKAQVRVTETRG